MARPQCDTPLVLFVRLRSPKSLYPYHALGIVVKPLVSRGAPRWFGRV